MYWRTDLQLSLKNSPRKLHFSAFSRYGLKAKDHKSRPRKMVKIWKAGENYKNARFVKYSTLNVASNKQ